MEESFDDKLTHEPSPVHGQPELEREEYSCPWASASSNGSVPVDGALFVLFCP